MNFKEGEVLFFDKPLTWTSFAVVNKIRYHLCRRMGVKKLKVGHAGTLDPLATGVMIICTGKATKRIEEFQYHTKEYVATLMLGATTPSYDLEKEIDAVLMLFGGKSVENKTAFLYDLKSKVKEFIVLKKEIQNCEFPFLLTMFENVIK